VRDSEIGSEALKTICRNKDLADTVAVGLMARLVAATAADNHREAAIRPAVLRAAAIHPAADHQVEVIRPAVVRRPAATVHRAIRRLAAVLRRATGLLNLGTVDTPVLHPVDLRGSRRRRAKR
jgi:hypothetical protein